MRPTILLVALLMTPGTVLAQEVHSRAMNIDQLQWMPVPSVLPKGAEAAVLSGDPAKPGPFTLRLKLPAGYKVPAHSHPTAELVTVLSGEFGFGMGDKLDEAKADRLRPGGFVDLPANMNHYALSTTETVIQINSEGPFAIRYANPADDPSKSQ
jgi:quercetin dioxygenase-like cupin family protein